MRSDRVGPTIGLEHVELPPAVARGFADRYGTGTPVETDAAWVAAARSAFADGLDRPPTADDRCAVTDGDRGLDPASQGRTSACSTRWSPRS